MRSGFSSTLLLTVAAALPLTASWVYTAETSGPELVVAGQPLTVRGDLGSKRSNWNTAVWSVSEFPARDLRSGEGLRITATIPAARKDIELSIALREADGTWRYHPRACPLSALSNQATVRFADFVPAEWLAPGGGSFADENSLLDVDAITAVAIGIINPYAAGAVEATVTALEVVPATPVSALGARTVTVSGRLLDVNGTTMVPAGLFGGFNVPKNTHETYRLAMSRVIGSLGSKAPSPEPGKAVPMLTHGDRGGAPAVVEKDWRTTLAAAAKSTGAAAGSAGVIVEFWNEPYLNWANKNRVAFRNQYYTESAAVEGGPVALLDGTVMPHLKWTKNYDAPPWNWVARRYDSEGRDHWRRGRDASGKVWSLPFEPVSWSSNRREWMPTTHPPKDIADGATYSATFSEPAKKKGEPALQRTLELTAFTPWYIYDETQFTFWSATGMGYAYNEPMVVAGKALKEACPQATYIIGWCSRPTEDHLAAWNLAYKGSIDAAGVLADGVNDHDYGGDPARMEASAELVAAYGVTTLGKMLNSYNTETSAAADPAAYPGDGGKPDPQRADRVKYRWAIRKLIGALARQPDKMRSFAFFGNQEKPPGGYFSPTGEGIAFALLKSMRGSLVQVTSDDPALRVVAAIDGTDPMNPRPADMAAGCELSVAIYNSRSAEVQTTIALTPPVGTVFASPVVVRRGSDGAGNPALSHAPMPADGMVTIPGGDAVVVTVALSAAPTAAAQARRLTAFSPLIATEVTPSAPYQAVVTCAPALVELAKRPGARAWLRLATGNIAAGEATVNVAGNAMAVPAVIGSDNGCWLTELPLPASAISAQVPLTLTITNPARTAGVTVAAISLYVEADL